MPRRLSMPRPRALGRPSWLPIRGSLWSLSYCKCAFPGWPCSSQEKRALLLLHLECFNDTLKVGVARNAATLAFNLTKLRVDDTYMQIQRRFHLIGGPEFNERLSVLTTYIHPSPAAAQNTVGIQIITGYEVYRSINHARLSLSCRRFHHRASAWSAVHYS